MSDPIATETALTSEPSSTGTQVDPPAESVTSDAVIAPAVVDEAPSATGETAASPAAEDATPPDQPPAATPRRSAEQRIREAIAEREFWKRQALSGNTPASPAVAKEPDLPAKPPAIEDFEDVNAWSAAYSTYVDKRAELVVDQRLGKVREQEQVATARQAFEARQQAFEASIPDYVEVVSDPDIAQYVTPEISGVIVRSDLGPQLSYHLGHPDNRNELVRLSKLPSAFQLFELGKLEARLGTQPIKTAPAATPAPKKVVQQTRAPAPPNTITGSQSPTKRPEDMDIREYMQSRGRVL